MFNNVETFAIGFLAGIAFGWLSVLLYCALVTAGRADDQSERSE